MVLYDRESILEVERECERLGLTQERLMENAGTVVVKAIRERFELEDLKVLVVCGKGNNGGDGFVIARRLLRSGAKVAIALAEGMPVTDCAASMFEYAKGLNIRVIDCSTQMDMFASVTLASNLIVDAVFGIGFHGELTGMMRDVFDCINSAPAKVFSVDVPSGVRCDSATAAEGCVNADYTVTFFERKLCHVAYPAKRYCGEVILADIGAPDEAYLPSNISMLADSFCDLRLPARDPEGHKGSFGKVGFICGSYGMIGSAAIAATAAMRSGIGLAVMAVSESVYPVLAEKLNEPVFKVYGDDNNRNLSADHSAAVAADLRVCDSVLIGCGLGRNPNSLRLVQQVVEGYHGPIVLDADGINCAADHIHILQPAGDRLILTPHYAEMARLCHVSISELMKNRVKYGKLIAENYCAVVVLKGATTMIFTPEGRVFVATEGNDGMATAGSGDMLAGIISAFAAQCDNLTDAAVLGVLIHNKCGNMAAEKYSRRSMIASDMLEQLKEVYLEFE